jgi:hypothetical protein
MAIYLDGPLDDEPLFGIVARYLESGPSQPLAPTIRRLFGRVYRASCTSGGLDHVAYETQACWGLSPTQIADQMTAFPYYAAISSPERTQLILERMCGLLPASARRVRMMATCIVGRHGQRYCPVCLREDKLSDGVPHWRRSHQLPGVIVCPWHGETLWEFSPHSDRWNWGYISPSAAMRLGTAPIDLNLTTRQKNSCQRFAQVSADLLKGRVSIDTCSFARSFRDFMRNASCYLRGARHGDCIYRLMSECFGGEYLEMHRVIKQGGVFFNALSEWGGQRAMRNVIALSLMRLVEEQPALLADWRFKDLYNHLPVREIPLQQARGPLPEVVCPSRLARHGPRHIVPKVNRRFGRLQAACSCGMRFLCAETVEGGKLLRVTRWGPYYQNEVRRLRAIGIKAPSIARRLGMPVRTVFNMLSSED